MRWRNINIPQGSIINSAYIRWRSSNTVADPATTVIITGEDEDTCLIFSTLGDYDGRSRTDATVEYNIPATSINVWYDTTDLSSIIQEIIDRPGWESGNAIALFNGPTAPAPYIVTGLSFDHNDGTSAPKLFITWSPQPSEDLPAEFEAGQDSVDLPAEFKSQTSVQLSSQFCVHTVRVAQDLSTWTEYDPQNELAHDCNDSWWQDVPNLRIDTALMKIVGGGGLGSDFFHTFTLNVFAVQASPNGQEERICAWAGHLAMISQDFYGQNDFEIAALLIMATDTADQYQLKLIEKGGNETLLPIVWPNFQDRYIVIYKEGTKLIANIYQDAAHTILEDSGEITLSGDLNFQYISMPMSYGGAIAAETSSGYIDPIFGSMENLPCEFSARRSDLEELSARFESGQDSTDLLGKFIVRHADSIELLGRFNGQDTEDLPAHFDVHYRRIFGENWQRKMWFDGTYYWRSYYSLALDSFIFEYIHKTGLIGNTWTENIAARIDVSGFDASAL